MSLEEFSEEKIIYIFQGIRGHNQGFKVTIIRRIKDLVKHAGNIFLRKWLTALSLKIFSQKALL